MKRSGSKDEQWWAFISIEKFVSFFLYAKVTEEDVKREAFRTLKNLLNRKNKNKCTMNKGLCHFT